MVIIALNIVTGLAGLFLGIIVGQNFFGSVKRELNSLIDRIDGQKSG